MNVLRFVDGRHELRIRIRLKQTWDMWMPSLPPVEKNMIMVGGDDDNPYNLRWVSAKELVALGGGDNSAISDKLPDNVVTDKKLDQKLTDALKQYTKADSINELLKPLATKEELSNLNEVLNQYVKVDDDRLQKIHDQNTDAGTDKDKFGINYKDSDKAVYLKVSERLDDQTVLTLENEFGLLSALETSGFKATSQSFVFTAKTIFFNNVTNINLNTNDFDVPPNDDGGFSLWRGFESPAQLRWIESEKKWKHGVEGNLKTMPSIVDGEFTASDLVDNKLTVKHALGKKHIVWFIYTNNGNPYYPELEVKDDEITFDFTGIEITDTWAYVLMG